MKNMKKYLAATMTAAMVASLAVVPAQAEETGSVYLLNFKPETDEAWQDLAAVYTEQTGVEVTVLTAADGQYDTTLQAEMAKSEAPTIFTIGIRRTRRPGTITPTICPAAHSMSI